jgi:signal transduction histidine kinase
MKHRLAWPGRIMAIILVGFLVILLIVISLVFQSLRIDEKTSAPSAERLAAMVTLIETTTPSERHLVFAAIRSSAISARVVEDAPPLDLPQLWPAGSVDLIEYQNAVAGHALIAYRLEGQPLIKGGFGTLRRATEIRVELTTGEFLIVTASSNLATGLSGVPLGYLGAILGLLVALAVLIFLHREFRPLAELAHAVEQIDPDDSTVTLPRIQARSRELRSLVSAFDRLKTRIDTLVEARFALLGGIQHDVRSFATRLRFRIEDIDNKEKRKKAEADIADLIALLDDALLVGRSGVGKLDHELVVLADLVASEVAERRIVGAHIELEVKPGSETVQVLGDRLALRRILTNLIDNALRYGKAVNLELLSDRDQIILFVDDNGPGIPASKRKLILEPFTRIEPSRARRTGGAGLGLAIVRQLVEVHDGQIAISEAPIGGARVSVRLPRFISTAT